MTKPLRTPKPYYSFHVPTGDLRTFDTLEEAMNAAAEYLGPNIDTVFILGPTNDIYPVYRYPTPPTAA
jgi:hypothetical protein